MKRGALGAFTAGLAATLVLVSGTAPLADAAAVGHDARLAGNFLAHGVVTRAIGIPGERRGQHVTRQWQFIPQCRIGVCNTVRLIRHRAGGIDRLRLFRRGPGYYTGANNFYVPVQCGRNHYRRGERAHFTITLTITSTATTSNSVVATGFAATYNNPRRIGLTPCYSPPSSDAASYRGTPAATP